MKEVGTYSDTREISEGPFHLDFTLSVLGETEGDFSAASYYSTEQTQAKLPLRAFLISFCIFFNIKKGEIAI